MTTKKVTVEHLGVGIDTARYGHHVSFLTPDRQEAARAIMVDESGDGYRKLQTALDNLNKKHPYAHFHVHIDAAGQYATNLERFLRALDLPKTVSVGQPKQNKDYHQAFSPKRKADATESLTMARFAVVEQPATSINISDEFYILREIAGRLQSHVKNTTQAINRLHNLLARVFPELAVITSNVASSWVLTLLTKYPTPERMARATGPSLAKIPYLSTEKANKVQAAAKQSVGTLRGELAEKLVAQEVLQVKQCQKAQKELEELLLLAYQALPATGHVQVESISGIGQITAAILVSKIISIDRFETAEKLVGYFGVFPNEHSSGVDRQGRPQIRTGHMSPKGNDLVRRYLFCAAKSAITHNRAVRALYSRLRARGTRGDVALGHCMRKLLQLVFGVWTSNKPFDENHFRWVEVPREPPADSESGKTDVTKIDPSKEKAAGLKRDILPARKEVTAATCTVSTGSEKVNGQPSKQSVQPKNGQVHVASRGSIDYAYLRSQVTIEQVLRKIGHFEYLRGKTQLKGPCPLHGPVREGSQSFSVNLKKNVFRCLNPQCAAKGNVIDFWAAYRNLLIYPAAIDLADTFHLDLTPNRGEATRKLEPPKHVPIRNP
jgi:transposase